jgi:hypothetical protein
MVEKHGLAMLVVESSMMHIASSRKGLLPLIKMPQFEDDILTLSMS